MLQNVILILVRAINIYAFLCFIRIILTWIPGLQFSGLGQFLSALCDPFLNMFRGVRWMQIGNLDFSPAISIGLLYALSSILQNIARTGRIYLGSIVAIIISMAWSIVSSLAMFLLILLVIRFAVILFQRRQNYYGSFWSRLDYMIEPLVNRIASIFTAGRHFMNYRNSLLVAIITLVVFYAAGNFLINFLIGLALRMPI